MTSGPFPRYRGCALARWSGSTADDNRRRQVIAKLSDNCGQSKRTIAMLDASASKARAFGKKEGRQPTLA
jgi:hypothetical protein